MTFFIDLQYAIYDNPFDDAIEVGHIDWWSNQVPEKGDFVLINSKELEKPVRLTVDSRTWSLLRQTGGGTTGHDVTVEAEGTI